MGNGRPTLYKVDPDAGSSPAACTIITNQAMNMEVIREKFTDALKEMKAGESVLFPLDKYASIVQSLIPRLRKEMWREGADWRRIGIFDTANGTFQIKRIK